MDSSSTTGEASRRPKVICFLCTGDFVSRIKLPKTLGRALYQASPPDLSGRTSRFIVERNGSAKWYILDPDNADLWRAARETGLPIVACGLLPDDHLDDALSVLPDQPDKIIINRGSSPKGTLSTEFLEGLPDEIGVAAEDILLISKRSVPNRYCAVTGGVQVLSPEGARERLTDLCHSLRSAIILSDCPPSLKVSNTILVPLDLTYEGVIDYDDITRQGRWIFDTILSIDDVSPSYHGRAKSLQMIAADFAVIFYADRGDTPALKFEAACMRLHQAGAVKLLFVSSTGEPSRLTDGLIPIGVDMGYEVELLSWSNLFQDG